MSFVNQFSKGLRFFVRKIPVERRRRTYAAAAGLPLMRAFLEWYRATSVDVYVISYPKVGRTWLRVMLGHAFALHTGRADVVQAHGQYLTLPHPELPLVKFVHEDSPYSKTPAQLRRDKRAFCHSRVILLTRDPRDAIVSNYFSAAKRLRSYAGDLGSFIRSERGGIETFVTYHNIWAASRDVPAAFLLLRYEDLHRDPARELRRVLDFCGLGGVRQEIVATSVEYGKFENMRSREANLEGAAPRFRPGVASDPESFKSRRGKVGAFGEYMSAGDVAFVEEHVRNLSPIYGYSVPSTLGAVD